jgi:hypothetical protein
MSIHWQKLDTAGRIAAIREVWIPGCTSTQIASCLEGATRNSIIGMYHRHPTSLSDRPLPSRSTAKEPSRAKKAVKRSPVTFLFNDGPKAKPLPKPREMLFEHRLCGRPLMLLQPRQCKWPVNESAGRGEPHLFCGLATEKTYCAVHAERARQAA